MKTPYKHPAFYVITLMIGTLVVGESASHGGGAYLRGFVMGCMMSYTYARWLGARKNYKPPRSLRP